MSRDSQDRADGGANFGNVQVLSQEQNEQPSTTYNIQMASNNINKLDMPKHYMQGQYEQLATEYDDKKYSTHQNMQTFNRRQYEDQPKSISNSSHKHARNAVDKQSVTI